MPARINTALIMFRQEEIARQAERARELRGPEDSPSRWRPMRSRPRVRRRLPARFAGLTARRV
jgi:hypothetical protein